MTGLASISYAVDSPDSIPVKVFKISSKEASDYICPVGYALTAISSSAEEVMQVMVDYECDDNACVIDRAHTLCEETPKYNFPIHGDPNMTYTCQKIKNHWAGTLISGKRG